MQTHQPTCSCFSFSVLEKISVSDCIYFLLLGQAAIKSLRGEIERQGRVNRRKSERASVRACLLPACVLTKGEQMEAKEEGMNRESKSQKARVREQKR